MLRLHRTHLEAVPPSTTPQVFLENSGSNGLAVDNDDKIIITDQRAKRLTRVDPGNPQMVNVVVPVGNYKPNDVIVRSDNNIYFTDPDKGSFAISQRHGHRPAEAGKPPQRRRALARQEHALRG